MGRSEGRPFFRTGYGGRMMGAAEGDLRAGPLTLAHSRKRRGDARMLAVYGRRLIALPFSSVVSEFL